MFCYFVAIPSDIAHFCYIWFLLKFEVEYLQNNFDVASLSWTKRLVVAAQMFLAIESFNDNSHEKVKEERINYELHCQSV